MKLDRLLAITMLLLNRGRVSAKQLADRFEVSLRTVYRDMETINQAGIPIVSYAGTSGGYEIMEQYRLERQYLTVDELRSIVVALKGFGQSLGEDDVDHLLDKVGALMQKSEPTSHGAGTGVMEEQVVIDLSPWRRNAEAKEKLVHLRQAIRDNRIVHFDYVNGQGEHAGRSCEPMSVVLKGYVWYLYGYCLLRGDFRVFRLSRITKLGLSATRFVRRAIPEGEVLFRWERHPGEPDRCIPLVLAFKPRASAKVHDHYAESQIELQPDGSLLVHAKAPDEPWLYSILLAFGADVQVIEPAAVAHKLRQLALDIAELYAR
ncbi:helix-turn-helix transcriptional regulator [Paenibacillus koleovorans]|uniref:helix-turn-helix transcriptional regulator n=1 Tax=Paenibacillus koleovorans TaxID=121608 RepID=UPI000FD77427|nr:YafY family protein [Paenibacillus koleovorans]